VPAPIPAAPHGRAGGDKSRRTDRRAKFLDGDEIRPLARRRLSRDIE
jgi:hypothetical protein